MISTTPYSTSAFLVDTANGIRAIDARYFQSINDAIALALTGALLGNLP